VRQPTPSLLVCSRVSRWAAARRGGHSPLRPGHLGYSVASQWISAYALAMALGPLIGGRLDDQYGRKRVPLAGLGAFTIASAVCAAAVSPVI